MSSSRALDELKEKNASSTHTRSYRDKIQMHTNNTQHTRIPLAHKQLVFIQNTWSHHVIVMFQ